MKTFAFGFAVVALALAACGGDKKDAADPSTTAEATAAASADAPPADTGAAPEGSAAPAP